VKDYAMAGSTLGEHKTSALKNTRLYFIC